MNDISTTAPITFEDVVAAVGQSDPAQTNASKVRALLGRGSFGTIQKHLEKLRTQRIQAEQPEAAPIPPAPAELLQMWGAAVAVATSQVRTRLDGVVQERDSLARELQSARGDVQGLTDELERIGERLEVAEEMASQAVALQQSGELSKAQSLASMHEAHTAEIDAMRTELEAVKHAADVARLEAKLGAQALQSTLERLTDQVGELKSLLHRAPG